MDTKRWDQMREVFTDDVVVDTTGSGGGVITGADDFMAFLEATLADVVTVHHGHMPEIELTSPTTATGIWALQDLLVWPERDAAGGLRPLPRDLRQGRRGVADRLVDADPRPHGPERPGRALSSSARLSPGLRGTSRKATSRSTVRSRGMPSTRSLITLRAISVVPPPMQVTWRMR